jgi:SAM-dependent methyltransferase
MESNATTNAVDQNKLQEFMMKSVNDFAGAANAMMVILGERLGLYRAMASSGPVKPEELAAKTNTAERYVREWLASQAAGGYITYNPSDGTFFLPQENALVLADENSPVYMLGGYQIVKSEFKDEEKFVEMFKTGKGLRWGDHHHDLFEGVARFYKPVYIANLVQSWIPSLDGMEEKLGKNATVADVGCGHGIPTVMMAKAYPNSRFYGYDTHPPSIEAAKQLAQKEGVADRTEFHLASANEDIGDDYDLVVFFDCIHDMGDPVGALRLAKKSLKEDGICMIVEPMASDNIEDNLNVVGRLFYSGSTLICVPNSLAENGPALGAQAGERRIRETAEKAGFGKFRRAAQTPFNAIYEAKL